MLKTSWYLLLSLLVPGLLLLLALPAMAIGASEGRTRAGFWWSQVCQLHNSVKHLSSAYYRHWALARKVRDMRSRNRLPLEVTHPKLATKVNWWLSVGGVS